MLWKNIFFIFILMFLCGCGPQVANRDSRGASIVCFGDSLTAGVGAGPGEDYPSILREKVDLSVANSGIGGDTTGDALLRLDRDVFAHDPRIVIITLGGNDFMRQLLRQETLRNIETIIDRIQEKGAMVVWAGVRAGIFGDAYTEDLKKLARQKRIVLIPNILKGILFDPKYKYDQIHPNSEGYKIVAGRILERIQPLLKE